MGAEVGLQVDLMLGMDWDRKQVMALDRRHGFLVYLLNQAQFRKPHGTNGFPVIRITFLYLYKLCGLNYLNR